MTDLILQYLNTLVSTVGNIERTYCIVERRSGSDGTTMPYEYVGGGNFNPVEVDGGSVSYFRLRAARTLETVDGRTAEKPIQATYPLRFVAMIRRDENNPEVYSQDVANILTGTNQDLRTILGANRAVITVTSIETDTPKIWQEEFTTPITEPKYSSSMVMIDLTVTVVATRSCWADCADYPDILQMFPWCNPATLERLTPEQLACIEGELCIPLCDQLAEVAPEDVVVDVFDCLSEAAQTELLDSECIIPPCADVTVEINGTLFDTVASGATIDIPVINGGSNPVGSLQGSDWVIGNNATFINSVQVTDQEAEIDANIAVELDGNPSGSWNAGTQTWEVTSIPCSPVTQQVNGTTIGTTVSGGTNNQLIRNTAGTAIGTAANPSVIANTTIRNSAAPTWTDSVVAGVTKTLAQGKALDSDGATTLLADYIPAADGFMFTCTPSPPCADATIEINGTAFDTVASGGTLDIPVINGGSNAVGSLQGSDWVIGNNATFINSVQVTDQEAEVDANIAVELDGNPSGSWNAGTQTWEVTSSPCADATVTINGASLGATGDIPSGGSEDLDVLQGGSPVGSWNGSAWIIPACPAVPSLSIALSDSTPNFGDAVTITVTPTGITPTSYTFGLPNKYGDLVNVTQASNVYVWTANNIGADSVVVTATDGASIAANSISVTTTVDVPFVSPKAVFSYYKLIAAYAGQWIRVRRTDTGVESDIPYTNGVGDISAITAFVGTSAFTVVTRYNQASNGNQTQTTASLQTVLKGDSFDVFQEWFGFNAQRMPLTLVSGLAANQTSTEYLIQKMSYNITGNTRISVDSGTTMIINSALVGSANSISLYDPSNVVYTPALRLTSKHLLTAQFKNADPRVRYNGANQALTVASGSTAAFATKAYTIKYLYGDNAAGFKSNEVASYAYCIDAGDLSAAVEAILMELYDI